MTGTARGAVVLAAALAGALVLGVVALLAAPGAEQPPVDRSGSIPVPRSTPAADRATPGGSRPRAGRLAVSPPRARPAGLDRGVPGRTAGPTRLRIDGAGVRMPVRPTGVDADGLMALPASPFTAGWYRWGAAPGDPRGAVVVAGHVDTAETGSGPLSRVAGLARGTRVELTGPGGSTVYRVLSVRRVPKRVLDLPSLFRRTGPPVLHLVTCGGDFDPARRSYEDNVVAVAEAVA